LSEYLVNTFREQRKLFEQSILELGIGVFGHVITMSHTARLYEVLEEMERRYVESGRFAVPRAA
jgi:hypothetical protein